MAYELRISAQAWLDIDAVLDWTLQSFGEGQREAYWELILAALADLARDPERARPRPEIHASARTLHIARMGRAARHFLLVRIVDPGVVEVGRLLYDGMDISLHLPPEYEP
ncbi:MAG TPA: type II toxin-antitoxin system RelE/ParE family toxin [Phycisphaerales bacterium]|nr:type II toxin-antitoxin system RelE/ParE family toxin [Phycisphaerales bacterium]